MGRRTESGFTLIELMVAMVVLLVGMLGVAQMVIISSTATSKSLQREGATTLGRDLLERARQVPYPTLVTPVVGDTLRLALPDGAESTRSSGTSFAVAGRRSTQYAVTVASCRIDQPSDGEGVHDTSFCDVAALPGPGGSTPPGPPLSAGLWLGGTALQASAGGAVLDAVCALLTTAPIGVIPIVDAILGRGNQVLDLVAGGATVKLCPNGERIALDLVPDDQTQVSVTVRWTERGGAPRELTQATIVPDPGGVG